MANEQPCQLLSVENQLLQGATERTTFHLRHWTFITEKGYTIHLYRRILDPKKSKGPVAYAILDSLVNSNTLFTTALCTLSDALYYSMECFPLTWKDVWIMEQAVLLLEDYNSYSMRSFSCDKEKKCFCECGCLILESDLKRHLRQEEHQDGDHEMKEWMTSVRQSLQLMKNE
jgi:hypothetical protein